MELYLDSADIKEIEEAFKLGILTGLTTTPTFMHRHGIINVDDTIIKLSKMVPVLQIEALGDTADEIVAEAHRLLGLGLDKTKTVFKIPVSNVGIQACKRLTDKGLLVNVHLIYTLNQAYMAMEAGATYVCPLVGRSQDHGQDALALIEQCVKVVEKYNYKSKIMFSSVRHAEHVRNALTLGAHTVTVPWGVMKKLTENHLTKIGTDQFIEHTRLMTVKVKDVIRKLNPIVKANQSLLDAIEQMNQSKLGSVTVVENDNLKVKGIFTDGDIRRTIAGNGKSIKEYKMSDFQYKEPISINAEALLYEAVTVFKEKQVDNILVLENNLPVGMLDIQDFVKMGLVG